MVMRQGGGQAEEATQQVGVRMSKVQGWVLTFLQHGWRITANLLTALLHGLFSQQSDPMLLRGLLMHGGHGQHV